ncbi:MAG: 30S ribosomal protein S2 [Planctomycetota bacterium]
MAKTLVRELISAGVHFGHGVSRWNPKMAPFIFAKRGNIHIIDVKKTLKGVLIAKKLLAEVVASGKDVVFVGTKRQAQKAVQAVAGKCGMHFVSERWLGGTLTNFRTIRSRLQRLEQLEAMQADGTLDGESKKMASRLKREMRKVKANLDGIRNMSRLPGAVVVIDARKEYLALREAKKLGVSTVGIIDTDSDPDSLILSELAEAVATGKTMVAARQEPATRPRRVRSRRPAMARARDERAEPVVAAEVSGAAPVEVEAKAEPTAAAQKPEAEAAKEAAASKESKAEAEKGAPPEPPKARPPDPKVDAAKPAAAPKEPESKAAKGAPPEPPKARPPDPKVDVAEPAPAPKEPESKAAKGAPPEPPKARPPDPKVDVAEPAAAPKEPESKAAKGAPPEPSKAGEQESKAEVKPEKAGAEPAKSAAPERETEQADS